MCNFDFRDLKKMENVKKLNKKIFHNKNNDIHKTANPIRETRVPKLVFIKITCLKFWALSASPGGCSADNGENLREIKTKNCRIDVLVLALK